MYDLILKRTCTKCDVTKHLSDFFVNKSYPKGAKTCKSCFYEYKREYRKNNFEKVKAQKYIQMKKYRENNTQKIKDYNEKNKVYIKDKRKTYNQLPEVKERHLQNERKRLDIPLVRAQRDATRRKYCEANRESISEKNKTRRESRTDIQKAMDKSKASLYNKDNFDRLKDIRRKWHLTEKGKACSKNYRAARTIKKNSLPIELRLSSDDWISIVNLFNNKCAYCQKDQPNPDLDHVVPLKKHGEHSKENVVPSCRNCNCSKHARDLWTDFIPYDPHPKLLELHPKEEVYNARKRTA